MINPKDPNDMLVRINPHSNTTKFTSALLSYFTETHSYLQRKFSEQTNLDYSQSTHFIKKDNIPSSPIEDPLDLNMNNDSPEESDEFNDEPITYPNNSTYYQQQHFIHPSNIHIRPRFNSTNTSYIDDVSNSMKVFNHNNNIQHPVQNENIKKGWICNNCQNINYNSRKQCNKCNGMKERKKNKVKRKYTHEEGFNGNMINGKFIERIGDWVCGNCDNLNFAFRKVCNRCQLPKREMEENGNVMNNNIHVNY